jgi:hypothetical protein
VKTLGLGIKILAIVPGSEQLAKFSASFIDLFFIALNSLRETCPVNICPPLIILDVKKSITGHGQLLRKIYRDMEKIGLQIFVATSLFADRQPGRDAFAE